MHRWTHRLRLPVAALALIGFVAVAGTASAERVAKPDADSAHHALIDGLKLIAKGDQSGWEKKYCSTEKLCFNENSRKSLFRYNWPAIERLVKKPDSCLKKGSDGEVYVDVKRTDGDPAKDAEVKIFIQCLENSMPRPFTLIKEKGSWRWAKL